MPIKKPLPQPSRVGCRLIIKANTGNYESVQAEYWEEYDTASEKIDISELRKHMTTVAAREVGRVLAEQIVPLNITGQGSQGAGPIAVYIYDKGID